MSEEAYTVYYWNTVTDKVEEVPCQKETECYVWVKMRWDKGFRRQSKKHGPFSGGFYSTRKEAIEAMYRQAERHLEVARANLAGCEKRYARLKAEREEA